MYPMAGEDIVSSSHLEAEAAGSDPDDQAHAISSLLYNLSILKDKVHQVQSLVSIFISDPDHQTHRSSAESTSLAIASMGLSSLVQEIIATASSMLFVCQQISVIGTTSGNNNNTVDHHQLHQQQQHVIRAPNIPDNGISQPLNFTDNNCSGQGFYSSNSETISWYGGDHIRGLQVSNDYKLEIIRKDTTRSRSKAVIEGVSNSSKNYDVVELDAADLVAKYTHYCQVCGKGFKRDANLRMHMRAHGDEYKSNAALTNPMKNINQEGSSNCSTKSMNMAIIKKYSCPQEGCRWNQKHPKFQPLKSMICVKNHYKRSHCPKMYVCKRCNSKQFSVLSDLRTHEKHCGDHLKWRCSCGTTFSRKDKLLGHVALFLGHCPIIATDHSFTKPGN